jgi:hypothetical protein
VLIFVAVLQYFVAQVNNIEPNNLVSGWCSNLLCLLLRADNLVSGWCSKLLCLLLRAVTALLASGMSEVGSVR